MKLVSAILVMAAFTLAGCGGGGNGESESPSQGPAVPDGISILAGAPVGGGSVFSRPFGVAVDGGGSVYVADADNHAIRKISPAGVVTTLAGKPGTWGSADGVGTAARFLEPRGVAVDGAGNLYVADTGNFTVRKIAPDGTVTTLAGAAGSAGSVDGVGTAAQFSYPWGIAADPAGNVIVSDDGDATIRRISPAGVVTTVAGRPGVFGWMNGPGSVATFFGPAGVAVDVAGRIYVAGRLDETVRTISPAGFVSPLAGNPNVPGERDGPVGTALFDSPTGIAVDAIGTVYVADADEFPSTTDTIRRIDPSGEVTTLAGTAGITGSNDGVGAAASFNLIEGLAVDAVGNVYAADTFNNTVRRITQAGVVTTVAGTPPITDSTCAASDGVGADAKFCHPQALATDRNGNVYMADSVSNTIRKITPGGVVSTLAGHAGVNGAQDGTGTAATFDGPSGIAVDAAGTVYVADTHTHLIRKISAAGIVTTLAGADWTGSCGGFGICFPSSPTAIALDGAGTLYVVDRGAQKVRTIAANGEVSIPRGLDYANVSGIAVDPAGNLYLSYGFKVSMLAPNGTLTTLAGSNSFGQHNSFDGVGPQAGFGAATDLALGQGGTVFVVDRGNNTIRRIARDGAVTTIVGQGGSSGVVLGPLPGGVDRPTGLAIDGNGVLYTISENAVLRIKLPSP